MVFVEHGAVLNVTVPKELDVCGGGRDPLFQKFLPEERVDHGTLARIELAHNDNQEELVKLLDGVTQRLLIFWIRPKLDQGNPQVAKQLALLLEQILLSLVQDAHPADLPVN
jgi:hypothetical protein